MSNPVTDKTTIQIGLVIILIGALVGLVMKIGEYREKVNNLETRIFAAEETIRDQPSKIEIVALKESITEIKDTLREISAELKKK